jgi:hypothetical protein
MKPPGALSKEELLALVKPGQVIYKVFKDFDEIIGFISHTVCDGGVSLSSSHISTIKAQKTIYLDSWFKKEYGYLFDNYFHALAYSLKLKAEHGQKTKSEERTGMEGAV